MYLHVSGLVIIDTYTIVKCLSRLKLNLFFGNWTAYTNTYFKVSI